MTARRLARHFVAVTIGIWLTSPGLAIAGRSVLSQRIVNDGPPTNVTACEREAYEAGLEPLTPQERRSPKKVRDVEPAYPELPPGTRVSGMWIGEIRLDTHGKVNKLWTIRPAQLTPPFPAFDKAIVDAVRQWQFEPFIHRGKARPFCMLISVKIDRR